MITPLKEAFEKRFPDPMTEKYGKGFALWCSNCHGESRDKIIEFIAERETLAEKRTLEMVEDKLRHYTIVCKESQRVADLNVKQFMSLLTQENNNKK